MICDQVTDSGIDADSESIPYSSLGETRSSLQTQVQAVRLLYIVLESGLLTMLSYLAFEARDVPAEVSVRTPAIQQPWERIVI